MLLDLIGSFTKYEDLCGVLNLDEILPYISLYENLAYKYFVVRFRGVKHCRHDATSLNLSVMLRPTRN